MSKWNPVRYRSTIHGEDGEIRLAADGLWTHPDDPSLDPSPLVDADGRQLGPDPVRYTPGNSPERAETYLTEADATEKEGVTALCENMGLKPRHRTRVVRLLALMYWRGQCSPTTYGRRSAIMSGGAVSDSRAPAPPRFIAQDLGGVSQEWLYIASL